MSSDFDRYLAAHKRFKAARKAKMGVEGLIAMMGGLLDQVKVEPELEAALATHFPFIAADPDRVAVFKQVLCCPEILPFLKEKMPKEYPQMEQQLVNYRETVLGPLRPAAKRIQPRLRNYPLCRTAVDVLLSHNLRLCHGSVPYDGQSNPTIYLIIVGNTSNEATTILHEAGHIFYNIGDAPSAQIRSKSGKTFPIHSPLEEALDSAAMAALEKDAGLADYLINGVKQRGNFLGELSMEALDKILIKEQAINLPPRASP